MPAVMAAAISVIAARVWSASRLMSWRSTFQVYRSVAANEFGELVSPL